MNGENMGFVSVLSIHKDDIETRARGEKIVLDEDQLEKVFQEAIRKLRKNEPIMEVFWEIITDCIEQRNRE